MTIKLSSKGGGGGQFKSTFFSGRKTVSSGAAGDFLIITPPSGQKVKLTGLASGGAEDDINITVGSTLVVNSLRLFSSTPPGVDNFVIGDNVGLAGSAGNTQYIMGDLDESITINKVAATANNIAYSYEFGV